MDITTSELAPDTPVTPTIDPASPADKGVTQDAAPVEPVTSEQPDPAAAPVTPSEEDKKEPSQGELNRKARNRERWQAMRQASEEAERLRREVDRLKGQPVDYSTIDDPDEVLALKTAAKVRETLSGDAQVRADEAQRRVAEATQAAQRSMIEEARERFPDFDAVFHPNVPVHQRMAPFVVESEVGPELAYYLGKNIEVARDLYTEFERNPAAALVKLGRIEAKLDAPAAKPKPSSAPKPAPVLTGGTSPLAFDPARSSVDDMAAELRKHGIIR